MALKFYKCDCIVGFPVMVDGTSHIVHFRSYSEGGGYYITNDKDEQEGIENSDYFKAGRITLNEIFAETEKEYKVKVEAEKRIVEGITKCYQARDWMKDNLGIDVDSSITRKEIFRLAEENNIEFPDLPKDNKK